MKTPAPSMLVVLMLASTLSRETNSFVFGPISATATTATPSPSPDPDDVSSTASRRPDKIAIRFPGPQQSRPLRNRPRLPADADAIAFPDSDVADNKRFERSRRQLGGFFDSSNPQAPNKPRGSGALTFPSEPPAWDNDIPVRPLNRPPAGRPQRPPWQQRPPLQRPPPSRPDNGFVFGTVPPPRPTTRRQRVTSPTTPRAQRVTVGAAVTRPTPASTRANCNCPTTPEFNPVCGGDRVTYSNPGRLKCANYCGNPVKMIHLGTCITTTTPRPTPPSRVPVRNPPKIRDPPQWGWLT